MRLLLPVVALVVLVGCGGGPCAQPTGTWRFSYTARSGNCAPSFEAIGTVGLTQAPAGCIGSVETSPDNCTTSMDVTCPAGNGSTVREAGSATLNQAATSGSGQLDLTAWDFTGTVVCHGTYDMTLTRL